MGILKAKFGLFEMGLYKVDGGQHTLGLEEQGAQNRS